MSYTPPSYNAVDFTWQGKSAYTPAAYNAQDFQFAGADMAFTVSSTSSFSGVGFKAGVNEATTSIAGSTTVSGVLGGLKLSTFTATAAPSSNIRGAMLKPMSFALTGTGTYSPRLGYGVATSFSVTSTVALNGVSSVKETVFSFSGTASQSLVGEWDGTSGGNFFLTPSGTFSAVGRSFNEAVFAFNGSTTVTPYPQAIWAVTTGITATGAVSAESVIVKPTYANMIMPWDEAPSFQAYSAFQKPASFAITATSVAAGAAGLKGDGTFTISGSTDADFEGLSDYTASVAFTMRTRPRGRFYSVDGRDNRFTVPGQTTVQFDGDFLVAPHAVEAKARVLADTAVVGRSIAIAQTAFNIDAGSRVSSYRGRDYDESEIVYTYTKTSPREVAIFIGA
jgi:hypothetical protein